MRVIEDLFGFDVNYLNDGTVEIKCPCLYPEDSIKCFELYRHLELNNIYNSGIEFPIRLSHWTISITPDNEETIKKYYTLDGIRTILDENISKLKDKTTYFKPEISYPPKSKFPILMIHFYDIVEDGGMYIIDDLDMFESICVINYERENRFTKKRIKDLEKLVNVKELQQIPFLPIELIQFNDDWTIKEIEQHNLVRMASRTNK